MCKLNWDRHNPDHDAALVRLLKLKAQLRTADNQLTHHLCRAIRLIAKVRGSEPTIQLLQQEIDILRGSTHE